MAHGNSGVLERSRRASKPATSVYYLTIKTSSPCTKTKKQHTTEPLRIIPCASQDCLKINNIYRGLSGTKLLEPRALL